jgi:hypothetical protein
MIQFINLCDNPPENPEDSDALLCQHLVDKLNSRKMSMKCIKHKDPHAIISVMVERNDLKFEALYCCCDVFRTQLEAPALWK